jgi:hypothetical protein
MAKSGNSKDTSRVKIAAEKIIHFKNLIKGHRKLLKAIGRL